jgi:hypothetical protein
MSCAPATALGTPPFPTLLRALPTARSAIED